VGQASGIRDFTTTVTDRAWLAIGFVVLATLVLLFLMTGSVVIPVKALVMNVLSLGAALGVTVWIFEEGHLESLLGFTSAGGVENTIPILVVAFGFGLSMDYEVFLLSRIVELHEQGHDTESAVTLGLQRSGRIITSAALHVARTGQPLRTIRVLFAGAEETGLWGSAAYAKAHADEPVYVGLESDFGADRIFVYKIDGASGAVMLCLPENPVRVASTRLVAITCSGFSASHNRGWIR
jgi:hypothetical protein